MNRASTADGCRNVLSMMLLYCVMMVCGTASERKKEGHGHDDMRYSPGVLQID